MKALDRQTKSVEYYVDVSGKRPAKTYIDTMSDATAQRSILRRLRLAEFGNLGDCKSVGEGVSEMKVHVGSGHRVYFGQDGNRVILLLTAGAKRTQVRDIEDAKANWKSYKLRKQEKADESTSISPSIAQRQTPGKKRHRGGKR